MLEYPPIIICSYLMGSVPFCWILAKEFREVDLRKVGSGNVGATNLSRVAGVYIALIGLLLDFAKGFIPVFVVIYFHGISLLALIAGFSAVCGHIWSPFLSFKGGKGVATSLGFITAFDWRIALGAVAVFFITMLVTKIVSISSIVASFVLLPGLILFHKQWFIVGIVLPILIIYTHRENIGRLKRGEERSFK